MPFKFEKSKEILILYILFKEFENFCVPDSLKHLKLIIDSVLYIDLKLN